MGTLRFGTVLVKGPAKVFRNWDPEASAHLMFKRVVILVDNAMLENALPQGSS
jgi:hypothetical protein